MRRLVHGDVFRRLIAARDYIAAHQATRLRLEDIARQAGLSPFHFLRLFRDAFDVTPHEHLTRLRIERAKALLARDASVTETCFAVGYESLGSFSALFARRLGRSPLRYQREVRRVVQVRERLTALYIPACYLAQFGASL